MLAGGGNNGGGGLCAARHLHNRGRTIDVFLATDRLGPAPSHHLGTLRAMGVTPGPEPADSPVVVDAMVGYGLSGPLRGKAAAAASWAHGRSVVSLDFPSGHGADGAVRADATLTLALPKEGLRDLHPVWVADLGLPAALWARMGLDVGQLFGAGRIVALEPPVE